jgi:hypothetical protein
MFGISLHLWKSTHDQQYFPENFRRALTDNLHKRRPV